MAIGERIRDLRWDAHLKQVELARRAGIAQNTLSQIELGNTVPSVKTLEKIAGGLGVEVSDLMQESALASPSKADAPTTGRLITRNVPDSVAVSDAVKPTILGHLDALEAALRAYGLNGELLDMVDKMREKVAA